MVLRKMQNSIDLRHNGVLSMELAKRLTEITKDIRKEYTDYIGDLTKVNGLTGIDWLISVTCRNPYQTKVFRSLCKLKLLESCIEKKETISSVVVENEEMYHAVSGLSKKHEINLTISILPISDSYPVLLLFRRLLVSLYIILISIVVPRLLVKREKSVPNDPIIFLDTYIKPKDFNVDGGFFDNYYSGLIENLPEGLSKKVWYVPVLYSVKSFSDLKWVIEKSRKSNRQFLIMEEWLKISDYLYSLYISLKLSRKVKQIPLYGGIDISDLIYRELFLDIFSLSLVRTVLIYRFISRLEGAGIEIERAVDWNENQLVDRALNLGLRKFYPATSVIGYQGYIVSDYYLSHSPACYEVVAKTIPDIIFSGCLAVVDHKREFCKTQKVSVAPAFRFQKLLKNRVDNNIEKEFILVALPYCVDVAEIIINVCAKWSELQDIKFIVKKHPAISKKVLFNKVNKLSLDCFEFSDSPLYTLFNSALMMISSDSSACFEAVACGVHVVIIGNFTDSTSNPLDGVVASDCWDICYDAACMQNVLEKKSESHVINLTSLLEPVNEGTVMKFLGYRE